MPLYNPVNIIQYPSVSTWADLPAAADNAGAIYIVTTSTGVWPFNRKSAGMWRSDGVSWTRLGEVPLFQDLSNPPSGGFKITNVYVNSSGKLAIEYEDTPM